MKVLTDRTNALRDQDGPGEATSEGEAGGRGEEEVLEVMSESGSGKKTRSFSTLRMTRC